VAGRSIQAVCRQNLYKRVPNSISSGGALKVENGCVDRGAAIVCRLVNREMFRLRHCQKIGEFGGCAYKSLNQIINKPMTK
jgi:hypothetical protein